MTAPTATARTSTTAIAAKTSVTFRHFGSLGDSVKRGSLRRSNGESIVGRAYAQELGARSRPERVQAFA